jgi:hypothetical protein
MMRFGHPESSDRISKLLVQAAVFVGMYFWLVESPEDVVQLQETQDELAGLQDELEILLKEREQLQGDVRDLRIMVHHVEGQRDQVSERLRENRVAELESRVSMKVLELPVEQTPTRRPVRKTTALELRPISFEVKEDEDKNSEPEVLLAVLSEEPSESLNFLLDDDLSVDPGRVEFRSKSAKTSKLQLDLTEDIGEVELEPYDPELIRSFADTLWYRTRQEAISFECNEHRGLARTRCVSAVNEVLDTLGVEAVNCVMSGNASPDYVYGLDTRSLPSHAIAMEQGALILCDSALLD